MILTAILLIFICVVLYLFKLRKSYSEYWKKRNIVQVDNLLWTFIFGKTSMAEVTKSIYDKYDLPHIGTISGTSPVLILKNVEDMQAVLAGDFQSFYKRGINVSSNDILADNLLFMGDFKKWKLLRQKLSPVFTSLKLKNMFYIIERCARDFVAEVETNKEMRQKPFNLLYTYTTASIGASVFGIDTQCSNTMDSPFIEMSWKSVRPSMKTNVLVAISEISPKLFDMLGLKIFGEHEDFFVGVVKKVLEARRHDTGKKRHDFIEICLELQNSGILQDPSTGYELNLTDEVIAAQAFFFFIAGADTTATAMHFTLLELASNQTVLQKLHKEIDSVFETSKKELSYEDIDKLQYLDMVINEAMRKYPPIGSTQRLCTKDTVLPSNVKISKDEAVLIPVFGMHRDEKYFPNPEKFDPERFHPSNISNINKYTFLPFGEGNRICIGARFARLQMKAGLTWLLRRYTLAEQNYIPSFERSPFALREPDARYDLILRNIDSN